MEEEFKRRRELQTAMLDKVGGVISAIKNAKHVDQVICALHSISVLLFPLDSHLVSGSIDQRYRDQLLSVQAPAADERDEWWLAFYQGAAFPTLARILLLDVASNWLPCFPFSSQKHIYDVFFVNGLASEVVQALVPCLQQNGSDGLDVSAIHSNTERLLVLVLLENDGVLQIARDFGGGFQIEDEQLKSAISRVAQIVASIPDKARLKAPTSLSAHFFFKKITIQLLSLSEQRDVKLLDKGAIFNKYETDSTLLFVGETFARICRRGSADVLLSEILPWVLRHVRSFLLSDDSVVQDVFESNTASQFWLKMMEAIKDPYAVERMSEQLLHQLVTEHVSDVEAYWILWILFHRISKNQTSVRYMFVDKFLLWKVFPVRCLGWILQFAVLECSPDAHAHTKGHNTRNLLHTAQRLVAVWSKQEFVQSASTEQQACILSHP